MAEWVGGVRVEHRSWVSVHVIYGMGWQTEVR